MLPFLSKLSLTSLSIDAGVKDLWTECDKDVKEVEMRKQKEPTYRRFKPLTCGTCSTSPLLHMARNIHIGDSLVGEGYGLFAMSPAGDVDSTAVVFERNELLGVFTGVWAEEKINRLPNKLKNFRDSYAYTFKFGELGEKNENKHKVSILKREVKQLLVVPHRDAIHKGVYIPTGGDKNVFNPMFDAAALINNVPKDHPASNCVCICSFYENEDLSWYPLLAVYARVEILHREEMLLSYGYGKSDMEHSVPVKNCVRAEMNGKPIKKISFDEYLAKTPLKVESTSLDNLRQLIGTSCRICQMGNYCKDHVIHRTLRCKNHNESFDKKEIPDTKPFKKEWEALLNSHFTQGVSPTTISYVNKNVFGPIIRGDGTLLKQLPSGEHLENLIDLSDIKQ